MDKNNALIEMFFWLLCVISLTAFALGIVVGEKVTERRLSASVSRVVPDNQIAGMGNN